MSKHKGFRIMKSLDSVKAGATVTAVGLSSPAWSEWLAAYTAWVSAASATVALAVGVFTLHRYIRQYRQDRKERAT